MTALPNQGDLNVPIEWQGSTQKTTMSAAGYELSGTIGIRPWKEMATLEWRLPAASAHAMMEQFRLQNFNSVYDYNCSTRGPIKIKLDGSYSMSEEYGTLYTVVTLGVMRV